MRCRRGSGRTGRGAGRNDGPVEASLGNEINLDGGVTTGVVDRAGVNLGDGHFQWCCDEIDGSTGDLMR